MTNDQAIDQQLDATPDATDAEIAAAVNAGGFGYVDVVATSVAQWLGENALREKIDDFIALPLPAADDLTYAAKRGLRAGLKQLLAAQTNQAALLDVRPGTGNRTLLDGAVAFGVIDAADVAGLMSRARPGWVDATEADVTARRAARVLAAAKDAALVALATYESSLRAAINAAETVDAIPEVPSL